MTKLLQVLVMAGGFGTRLLPLSASMPKPMIEIGGRSVLELLLRRLHANGISSVCIAVNHLQARIREFIRNELCLDLKVELVEENKPLGTCGAISLVLDRLAEDFILINGDVVTDLDLSELMAVHRASGAVCTVAVTPRTTTLEYGVIELDDSGEVEKVLEKPALTHLTMMGVYCFRRSALHRFVPPGKHLDTPTLVSALLQERLKVGTFVTTARWIDIGRPDQLVRAAELFPELLMQRSAP
jgi:NDP-mannose synthase